MKSITLTEPADGAVTRPLQRYYWPTDEERELEERGGVAHAPGAPIVWDALEASFEDRSFPESVLLAWQPPAAVPAGLTYTVRIGRDPDFREALQLKDLPQPRVEILHLHIATRYWWRVEAHVAGAVVAASPVWRFRTHCATPRWIAIPGITNVRDLGGWPLPGGRRVRQGLLYRSSEMNSHVQITDEGRRILVDELGIRTDLDLRGGTEEAQPVLDPRRVEWINVPLQPYGFIVDDRYREAYRRVFELLAEPARYPLIFHCWGGADRGGTVAFLVNALLGKSLEHLIRDYELTSLSIWGERSRWSLEFRSLLDALAPHDDGTSNVNRQVERYLLHIGVTPEQLRAIREFLVEPDEFDSPDSAPAGSAAAGG